MALSLRDAVRACCLTIVLFAAPAIAEEEPASEAVQQEAAAATAAPPETPAPATVTPAAAAPTVTMTNPRVTFFNVDWNAARAAAAALKPSAVRDATVAAEPADALVELNSATAKIFPKASASSVPVLLPFDTAAYLHDQTQGTTGDDSKYFSAFRAPTFFYPGPSGYDAAFSLPPDAGGGLDLDFARPVEVQISASTLIYQLDGSAAESGTPVRELESDFPGIRRVLIENRLRYVFTRFGVPYFVSIGCFDGAKSARRLACREADQVAMRFLKTLAIVGGAPSDRPAQVAAATIERPDDVSPDFTYYPPGDLLPGTGMNGRGGKFDTTVYAKIRFPMAHAPAYVNSQSFMNWGNCDLTGRIFLGGSGKEASYRCRVNDVPLVHDETRNYAYPWRDNFCEHRHYQVTQCPAGIGHQGEDIRPSSCKLRNEGADRCEPYQDQTVAVREGVVWREPGDRALYLIADAPGEHVRFRYLHMNPHMLDLAGMISGRALTEGEMLGPVGDYGTFEGGTSYHLHFDMQVPTRQGWMFVNPYMTLVAAYERLIGGRGQVVAPDTPNPPAPGAMVPPTPGVPTLGVVPTAPSAADKRVTKGKSETKGEAKQHERATATAHCQTRFVKGHRQHVCRTDVADSGRRQTRSADVRSVDRGVSLKGARAWHHAGDLRPRHERGKARHNRA